MNRQLFDSGAAVNEAQIAVLNSLLVLLLLPFFDSVVFPRLKESGFDTQPLNRMPLGTTMTQHD
jgi:hypothetical protein